MVLAAALEASLHQDSHHSHSCAADGGEGVGEVDVSFRAGVLLVPEREEDHRRTVPFATVDPNFACVLLHITMKAPKRLI